jgi:hypothetical protein
MTYKFNTWYKKYDREYVFIVRVSLPMEPSDFQGWSIYEDGRLEFEYDFVNPEHWRTQFQNEIVEETPKLSKKNKQKMISDVFENLIWTKE